MEATTIILDDGALEAIARLLLDAPPDLPCEQDDALLMRTMGEQQDA